MLFADMEEREEAWKELEREGVFELVGSLQYNIEINAVGVDKGNRTCESWQDAWNQAGRDHGVWGWR